MFFFYTLDPITWMKCGAKYQDCPWKKLYLNMQYFTYIWIMFSFVLIKLNKISATDIFIQTIFVIKSFQNCQVFLVWSLNSANNSNLVKTSNYKIRIFGNLLQFTGLSGHKLYWVINQSKILTTNLNLALVIV